jgi:hypothetical protein
MKAWRMHGRLSASALETVPDLVAREEGPWRLFVASIVRVLYDACPESIALLLSR